ncbi:MAG: hypothetical protein KJ718_02575 [Nanoarchaeota archaeon]|nr:hypothetical protein [Nanoarchaeota archaeon]MBU1051415.1 hypothetical protein [Nanoarchaeota archaeon]MBU1988282.1 hypothetical protein [Nanoarchaeota archaeon]
MNDYERGDYDSDRELQALTGFSPETAPDLARHVTQICEPCREEVRFLILLERTLSEDEKGWPEKRRRVAKFIKDMKNKA